MSKLSEVPGGGRRSGKSYIANEPRYPVLTVTIAREMHCAFHKVSFSERVVSSLFDRTWCARANVSFRAPLDNLSPLAEGKISIATRARTRDRLIPPRSRRAKKTAMRAGLDRSGRVYSGSGLPIKHLPNRDCHTSSCLVRGIIRSAAAPGRKH